MGSWPDIILRMGTQTQVVLARMPAPLIERIDAWASDHGCERSEAVRQLVTFALDSGALPSITLREPLKWMLAQTEPKKQRHECSGAGGQLVAVCQGNGCHEEWKHRPRDWAAIVVPDNWDLREQVAAWPGSVVRATSDGYWILTPVSNLSRLNAQVAGYRAHRLTLKP